MIPAVPRPPSSGSSSIWAVTLTDLGFLILTFFVLSFAMSSPRLEPWREARQALAVRLGPGLAPLPTEPVREAVATAPASVTATDLSYLAPTLEARLAGTALGDIAALEERGGELVVRLPADRLLRDDGAIVAAVGPALRALGGALRFLPNDVSIVATARPADPSGAEVAAALAVALDAVVEVSSALQASGDARPLTLLGRLAPPDGTRRAGQAPQVGEIAIVISDRHGDPP
jgi:hypothetical protein